MERGCQWDRVCSALTMEPARHTSRVTAPRCCRSRLMAGWAISRYWLSKTMKMGFLESSSSLQSPSLRGRDTVGWCRPRGPSPRCRRELLPPEAAVAPVLLQVRDREDDDQAPAPAHVHDQVCRGLCKQRGVRDLVSRPVRPPGSSPTCIGQDGLLVQEQLVAVAVLQLRLHDEVDELAVIRGASVGHVGIVQLPVWGQPWGQGCDTGRRLFPRGTPL